MKQTAYQMGDRVVLSPYGLGIVRGTCHRNMAGETLTYYQVDFPETGHCAFVPVACPDHAGLRAALTSDQLPALLAILQGKWGTGLALPRQWSARQRRVAEILGQGQPHELATLAGELYRWNAQRALPDLDRHAFKQALSRLEQEVTGLEDKTALDVQQFLQNARAALNH